MADSVNLNGDITAPDLPVDRDLASRLIAGIVSKNEAVEEAITASNVPWATQIRGRQLSAVHITDLLDQSDWADLAVETMLKQIESIVARDAESFPGSMGEARHLLAELESLASRHREAALMGSLDQQDPAQLALLVEDVRHLDRQQLALQSAITHEEPTSPGCRALVERAGEAARILRDTYAAEHLDAAELALERLVGQDDAIKSAVRDLTRLATALNLSDPTIGHLADLAKACGIAGEIDPQVLAAMPSDQATGEAAVSAGKKAAKVVHAARMLDAKYGEAWRSEALSKLRSAAHIANTPGDPRQPKVGEYLRSFGVSMKFRESITAITKTRMAMEELTTSEALRLTYPRHFKGLETDFALLERGFEAFKTLAAALDGVPGGDRLLLVFASNTRKVVADFTAFSGLREAAARLPFDTSTPLRAVREKHLTRQAEIRACIDHIAALPVEEGKRSAAEARRLSRLVREIDGTYKRIEESELYRASGAHFPGDITAAMDWRARLHTLFTAGGAPKNDEGFAALLVKTRDCLATVAEWLGAVARIRSLLGEDIVPTELRPFAEFAAFAAQMKQVEPALHAQVHLCERMTVAIDGGLRDFVARMGAAGHPVGAWPSELGRDYALVDRAAADDAFAAELTVISDEAAAIEIPAIGGHPLSEGAEAFDPTRIDAWIEEEIAVALAQYPIVAETEAAA